MKTGFAEIRVVEIGVAALGLAVALLAALCLFLPPAAADEAAESGIYRIPDPIAQARARIEETCLNAVYGDDFVRRMDLNADGLEDVVITDNVICDGYHSMFCGVGGCSGEVYIALPGGGYALTDLPPNVSVTVARGRPAVRASGRGRTAVYVWLGDRFVIESEVGRKRVVAASAYAAAAAEAAMESALASVDLAAAEALYGLDGADIDVWTASLDSDGAAHALVRGADGASALILSCSAGQAHFELSLRPSRLAADVLPYHRDARIEINAVVNGRVIERLALFYNDIADLWRVAIPSRGVLLAALSAADAITFRQEGALDRIARFGLDGSSRAIEALRRRCLL